MIIRILHMRKPRHQEVKYLSQVYVVNQMAGQGFEPDVWLQSPDPGDSVLPDCRTVYTD